MKYVSTNRDKMIDSRGHLITQSLFLECNYDDMAIYTLKDEDYEYNGKLYKSLKKLYIEEADPTEYGFATKYMYSWKHWLRCCDNKLLRSHINEWRDELEVKLRCQAFNQMIDASKKGKAAATKWLADKGWANRPAGRPSKAEIEREKKIQANIANEYSDDVVRLFQQKQ
jgi:hypothetical protein